MKYKTLFRLALKFAGVIMLCYSISSAVWLVQIVLGMLFEVSSIYTDEWSYFIPQLISFVLEVSVGLYLFFGGEWIVNKAIPSNRPYCHECGYELRNLTNNRCPECGTPTQPNQTTNQTTETTLKK